MGKECSRDPDIFRVSPTCFSFLFSPDACRGLLTVNIPLSPATPTNPYLWSRHREAWFLLCSDHLPAGLLQLTLAGHWERSHHLRASVQSQCEQIHQWRSHSGRPREQAWRTGPRVLGQEEQGGPWEFCTVLLHGSGSTILPRTQGRCQVLCVSTWWVS